MQRFLPQGREPPLPLISLTCICWNLGLGFFWGLDFVIWVRGIWCLGTGSLGFDNWVLLFGDWPLGFGIRDLGLGFS